MFTPISIRRLSAGSVFKLAAVGFTCCLVPLSTFFGLLSLFGAGTVTWNGRHLTGLAGLVASPFIGLVAAAVATLLLGTTCACGLWLYARVGRITIVVQDHRTGNGSA